ncbi:hypothetical protein CNMCM8980_002940 [Aspergillus fumigatiaffinis]|uniref:Uncharacterized protein n=1 Tax=Aspergillus fumigatiaffinis TaxID=340414 RepID=A0A8H4GSL7_9EURO|nr:hypothetical protein CNMCM6805_003119 [Aspergillus fumigatiaffinis]KAF4236480.1 hypothetical protein CNMCM8980_002940 [Aspergillus fumigatiaffinis]
MFDAKLTAAIDERDIRASCGHLCGAFRLKTCPEIARRITAARAASETKDVRPYSLLDALVAAAFDNGSLSRDGKWANEAAQVQLLADEHAPKLESFVKETFRLYDISPLVSFRRVMKSATLDSIGLISSSRHDRLVSMSGGPSGARVL